MATEGTHGSHPWPVCNHPRGCTRAGEADSLCGMVQRPTALCLRRPQETGLARQRVL